MDAAGNSVVRAKRSEQLLSVVAEHERVTIVTHDKPDPDAIATGWAVLELIAKKLGKTARLVGGGRIVRAENRHMVRLLKPPLELVDSFEAGDGAAVLLVDCGVEATNHLIAAAPDQVVGVIDHHESPGRRKLAFQDIRPGVAASAAIATAYLREQSLEPDARLATALLYAMYTETRGSAARYSPLDRAALPWLSERADPSWLAEIQNAPLSWDYYSELVLALQNTFVYDDVALCLLPRAEGAEIIGEVADLLIRCDGIRRVLCGAVCGGDVLVSLRTSKDGGHATHLLREVLRGLGRGGGHTHRAGGKLTAAATGSKVSESLHDVLRSRWLATCGVDRQRGTRLVAPREIVENLEIGVYTPPPARPRTKRRHRVVHPR